jgi:hypothetical protein
MPTLEKSNDEMEAEGITTRAWRRVKHTAYCTECCIWNPFRLGQARALS